MGAEPRNRLTEQEVEKFYFETVSILLGSGLEGGAVALGQRVLVCTHALIWGTSYAIFLTTVKKRHFTFKIGRN